MSLFHRQWSVMDDMVFEKKNKSYGAYVIRKKYQRTIILSFVFSLLIISLLVAPSFIGGFISEKAYIEEVIEVQVVDLMEPPEFEIPLPPIEQKLAEETTPIPEIKKVVPPAIKPPELEKEVIPNPNSKLAELFSKSDTEVVASARKDSLEQAIKKERSKGPLKIYVDAVPDFPGGNEGLFAFFAKNIVYPKAAKNNGISGTVFVSFIVHANGKASDARILSGLGAGCDEEVIRVINTMPAWTPGRRFGKSIDFMYNIPVQFALK